MSVRKTVSAIGERQMFPVQTKQIRNSADSSKARPKLMQSFSPTEWLLHTGEFLTVPGEVGIGGSFAAQNHGVDERLDDRRMLLRRLVRDLESAAASLPPPPGDDWRGPARDAYALLLAEIRSRIVEAQDVLERST
jgi:hypothetical protein